MTHAGNICSDCVESREANRTTAERSGHMWHLIQKGSSVSLGSEYILTRFPMLGKRWSSHLRLPGWSKQILLPFSVRGDPLDSTKHRLKSTSKIVQPFPLGSSKQCHSAVICTVFALCYGLYVIKRWFIAYGLKYVGCLQILFILCRRLENSWILESEWYVNPCPLDAEYRQQHHHRRISSTKLCSSRFIPSPSTSVTPWNANTSKDGIWHHTTGQRRRQIVQRTYLDSDPALLLWNQAVFTYFCLPARSAPIRRQDWSLFLWHAQIPCDKGSEGVRVDLHSTGVIFALPHLSSYTNIGYYFYGQEKGRSRGSRGE